MHIWYHNDLLTHISRIISNLMTIHHPFFTTVKAPKCWQHSHVTAPDSENKIKKHKPAFRYSTAGCEYFRYSQSDNFWRFGYIYIYIQGDSDHPSTPFKIKGNGFYEKPKKILIIKSGMLYMMMVFSTSDSDRKWVIQTGSSFLKNGT